MNSLSNLKSWMKPHLKRFVRFINRLETRLEEQERARKRRRRHQPVFGLMAGHAIPPNPSLGCDPGFEKGVCEHVVGAGSAYAAVRVRDPSYYHRLES